jgi:hypothetical protein
MVLRIPFISQKLNHKFFNLNAKFSHKEGFSCFLETQNDKNVPLYKHFGFEVMEATAYPNTDIGLWSMLRKD